MRASSWAEPLVMTKKSERVTGSHWQLVSRDQNPGEDSPDFDEKMRRMKAAGDDEDRLLAQQEIVLARPKKTEN